MPKKSSSKKRKILAQSATELAIFGAILIFVIGLIVRTGLHQGQTMNSQLRVMRLALTESYKTAHGYYRPKKTGHPSGSRNTASVLLVEDRISVDSAQAMGTHDRIPFMSSGSGTMSHNLFWSMDYGNRDDLPMFDLIVNGQWFPLTTGRYMQANLPDDRGAKEISYHYYKGGRKGNLPLHNCTSPMNAPACWAPDCVAGHGCVVVFKAIYNVPPPAGEEWCDAHRVSCPSRVNIEERFDLDHNGNIVPDVELPEGGLADGRQYLREVFHWQWMRAALTKARTYLSGFNLPHIMDSNINGVDIDNSVNRSVDLDGDLQEEYILETSDMEDEDAKSDGFLKVTLHAAAGPLSWVRYIDYQEGDVDFGRDDTGLKTRVFILSKTEGPVISDQRLLGGTYMLVEEGKLYGADGQFIRDATRHDHIDVITRLFQLSNNTGRFCTTGGQVVRWDGMAKGARTLRNPVEACGSGGTAKDVTTSSCWGQTNYVEKTCFDIDSKMLYIRSRIEDLRGKRWITRVLKGD